MRKVRHKKAFIFSERKNPSYSGKAINMNDLLALAQHVTSIKKTGSYNGEEWTGACPICGGTDRFHVWPKKDTFWCRQCDGSGKGAVKFVMWVDGVDYRTACERLGIQHTKRSNTSNVDLDRAPAFEPSPVKNLDTDKACFEDAWQAKAEAFIGESVDRLLHDPHAQAYLEAQRHVSRGNWLWASLGFNDRERWEQWGSVKVWLPRGIVIPWMVDDVWWRIRFRCLDGNYQHFTPSIRGKPMKYPQVKGAADALYFCGRSTLIEPDDTVILVEGEFDALAVQSNAAYALNDGLKAVATGGTQNARVLRWVASLSIAKVVYLAFDGEDSAGALAAVWWGGQLPNAQRLIPSAHDVSDMVSAGHDLYDWLGFYRTKPKHESLTQLSMFGEVKHHNYRERV